MEGTYPLFSYHPTRTLSRLGAMCLPLEEQLEKPEAAKRARDQEVRAHSAQGPLFVKFQQARWLRSDASRRQHREAAWDIARAALKADIGKSYCTNEPGMIDHAWAFGGMPRRGQPITLRQVIRLSRIVDYLHDWTRTGVCSGSSVEHERAGWKLAVALGNYRKHADADIPPDLAGGEPHAATTVTHTVVHTWTDPSERGSATATATAPASQVASPTRHGPGRPSAADMERAAPTGSAPWTPHSPCMHPDGYPTHHGRHMAWTPGKTNAPPAASMISPPLTPHRPFEGEHASPALTPHRPPEVDHASPSRSPLAASGHQALAMEQGSPEARPVSEEDFRTPTRVQQSPT